ncbi:MAG: hypothetical protein DDG60_01230 [Anaerolineae bacterium]|nr:MAG: hypothetical protein DDG60_01230 [Anaerolineae bacterium]
MRRKVPSADESTEILLAEFEYIAQTAFQANEDRSRATSFYLVTFGSFIAALISAQIDLSKQTILWLDWGFCGLFTTLAIMGLVTTLELARLRLAWYESLQAMNAIKEYAIRRNPELAEAIRWRMPAAPPLLKPNSLGFLMLVQVAVLGAAALGAAVFFFTKALGGTSELLPAILSTPAYFLILLEIYRAALKNK